MDATGIAYAAILLFALVGVANWIAPANVVNTEGCVLNYVYDGDTVALDCPKGRKTVRIVGYDTPETKKPGCDAEAALGRTATQRLRALVQSGDLAFEGKGFDKYGRMLAVMTVDGVDIARTLLAEGLAVPYYGGSRINWCRKLGSS